MAPEILDLDALTKARDQARIKTDDDPDGTLYDLLMPEELGVTQFASLSRMYVEHDELWEKERRTKAEDKRLELLLNDLACAMIPDAPPASVKQLSAVHKRGLAVRFFVATGLVGQQTMGSTVSRLVNSSPDSPDSSEEIPASG